MAIFFSEAFLNFRSSVAISRNSNLNLAPFPDDTLFIDLSLRYSETNLPMYNSVQFEDGITNGADWYSITGGMQDWNYRFAACNEVTIELSNVKTPLQSQLPDLELRAYRRLEGGR